MDNMKKADHQLINSSNSNEWYTPPRYVEAAREVLGAIDLDPASCETGNRIVRAKAYFAEARNGLVQRWYGRVFLNPPYGRTGGKEQSGHLGYPAD